MREAHAMEKPGFVSIWLGNFESDSALREFLEFKYDRGDEPSSLFCSAVDVDWFDEDNLEARWFGCPLDESSISGFSYAVSFENAVRGAILHRDRTRSNSLILIFDFAYSAEGGEVSSSALQFLGVFAYRKTA